MAEAFRLLHPYVIHFTARDAIRDVDAGGLETALGRAVKSIGSNSCHCQAKSPTPGWVTVNRTQGEDRRACDAARAISFLNNLLLT